MSWEKQRKVEQERRKQGLCGCGRIPRLNRKLCLKCAERGKKGSNEKRVKTQQKGLCVHCYKNKAIPGSYCLVCKEKVRNTAREERKKILDVYGSLCICCGETEPVFLCIDHIDGGGHKHRKKVGGLYAWLKKNNYPKGFQILCWNCNSAKHLLGQCPHQTKRKDHDKIDNLICESRRD